MYFYIKTMLFAVCAVIIFAVTSAEVRWCANGTLPGVRDSWWNENATQYNDELNVCMECSKDSKLVLLDDVDRYECCEGRVSPVGICTKENLLHICGFSTRCDTVKQCYDSWDEVGCYGCSNKTFSCNDHETDGQQCLPMSKVCDGVKDCRGGKDETLCPYYGGWCDGYLCGGKHPKCLNYSQVCDGVKDCVDGADETNCQYCLNQFRCRVYVKEEIDATSAECVGRFRVCDGIPDCQNGADELDCYRWNEWGIWSECGTVTESCTRIRRRSCIDQDKVVVSSSLCYGGDDVINENHIDICPECLIDITTNTPTTVATTTTTTESTTRILNTTTTQSYFTRNSSTDRIAGAAFLPFDTGAKIGVAVAGGLVAIAIVIALLIAMLNKKSHRGFWRPPTKLPRSSSSNLPGMSVSRGKKVKPENIRNPYDHPRKAVKVVKVPKLPPSTVGKTMSIRSVSGNGIDSGIEDGVDTFGREVRRVAAV